MSLAEQLYSESATKNYETPPRWLDISFAIIISAIHIFYAFKFTKFSLCFLNTKCQEKQSGTKWPWSKVYLQTIASYGQSTGMLTEDDNIKMHLNNISLWTQLRFLRNILRILIFVLCWVVLVLYMTLILNISFEYLIACIVNYEKGSFLALIVLPLWVFINIVIIKYIFFGIMASWSINADMIADEIAEEKEQQRAKVYALQNTVHISVNPYSDGQETEEKHEQKAEKKEEKALSLRHKLWTPYFMAVHWRLSIICCSILCTMVALPAMQFEGDHILISDTFWFQIFLRFMLMAVMLWLFVYFMISMLIALFGRISTLSIYRQIIQQHHDGNKQTTLTNWKSKMKGFFHFFCILDAFSLSDTHIAWKRCKIFSMTLIFVSGFLLIVIGLIINIGLIWFVGAVFIAYYIINIILTSKPRGLHYLWKCDINALQLDINTYTNIDFDTLNDTNDFDTIATPRHITDMTHLTQRQLNRLLTRHMTKSTLIECQELHIDSAALSHSDDNKEEKAAMQSEQDVIQLFCKLHKRITDDRKALYAEREKLNCTQACRESFCCCCPGIVRAINCILLCNFIYSVFKQYKAYWLLILPYDYQVRPLSLCPTGRGAVLETIFKFDYKNNTLKQTISTALRSTWNGIKGFVCCVLTAIFLFLLLWISLNINKSDTVESGIVIEENAATSYPVCDTKWNGNLSVLDLSSLSHLVHEVGKREVLLSMQDMLCLYFDSRLTDCQWEVMHISRAEPVFMHLRHNQNRTDVLAIRGTESTFDSLQDFNLFNQVILLQTFSWVVPVTSLLPRSFIIQIVYFMSFFEGSIDTQLRQRYDVPVFLYAYNLLTEAEYAIDSLYVLGHSLGGSVSQAVVAQLHHLLHAGYIINQQNKDLISAKLDLKSFSYGSPGLVFNSRKFSFDLTDLYDTATLLKISHDAISNIDEPGGLVQNVECSESQFYQCHKRKNIICELGKECGLSISNNPLLIKTMCANKDISGGYVPYMLQLYNLSNTTQTTE